ncbi:hypothetical protein [Sphingomonas plantiphila]
MKRNLREGGGDAATEVYRISGSTPDKHLYFDVYSMRKWAMANVAEVTTFLDWGRAERLISSGAIDRNRITEHTIHNQMEPIIIGIGAAGPGNDQILDGGHRYVAYALGATAAGLAGAPLPLPAYPLTPDQWKQFLIPRFIAQTLGFDANYDSTDFQWPSGPVADDAAANR